jgi:hypothetical protein
MHVKKSTSNRPRSADYIPPEGTSSDYPCPGGLIPAPTSPPGINIQDLSELDTLDELVARYPKKFSKPQLQWQLRFRDENGLSECVVKFGRRLYIHRPSFAKWLASRRDAA